MEKRKAFFSEILDVYIADLILKELNRLLKNHIII
jgi:hypothetical protein